MNRVKTCSCTLPYTNPKACEACGMRFDTVSQQLLLPVDPTTYDIDFGDDFILLRRKK